MPKKWIAGAIGKKDVVVSLMYHSGNLAFQDEPELGNGPHAFDAMRHLGITFKDAVPFTTIDCWRFYDCENIPEDLPSWASVQPHKGFFGMEKLA